MVVSQYRSKRKASGGRYVPFRGKKKKEMGRLPTFTRIGKRLSKLIRGRGCNKKTILVTAEFANVFDSKTKKYSKIKIEQVVENPANRHYVRRNILTKGTIIKTSKGNARVTSRPGQEGMVNAVLVK
jgi:small subunit ribosomal protein S8e